MADLLKCSGVTATTISTTKKNKQADVSKIEWFPIGGCLAWRLVEQEAGRKSEMLEPIDKDKPIPCTKISLQ